MMNIDAISKKLVKLRGNKRQEDIAKSLNIAQSTYAMYETGKRIPSDKVKIRIANYYDTTVEDIFFSRDITEAEIPDYGLSPTMVYRRLREEYYKKQCKKNSCNFSRLETSCDDVARQLYAGIKNRQPNVKSLILTYQDAENVFELFKQFADVWITEFLESEGKANE